MKPFKTVSWLFQLLFLSVSVFFAVPLSLAFSIPAVLFLWTSWLTEFLNHWLVVVALLFMGLELGFLLGWPIGVGIAFLALYFLLWSWLHTLQLHRSFIFWGEMFLPLSFLFVFMFMMKGSAVFWSVQAFIIVFVQLLRWWRRRVHAWSITHGS